MNTFLLLLVVVLYVCGALATVAADSFVVNEPPGWGDVIIALEFWPFVAVWMFADAVRGSHITWRRL
jgi:hypothetical protein